MLKSEFCIICTFHKMLFFWLFFPQSFKKIKTLIPWAVQKQAMGPWALVWGPPPWYKVWFVSLGYVKHEGNAIMLSKITFSALNSLGTGIVKAGISIYFVVLETRPVYVAPCSILFFPWMTSNIYTYMYTMKLCFSNSR